MFGKRLKRKEPRLRSILTSCRKSLIRNKSIRDLVSHFRRISLCSRKRTVKWQQTQMS